MTLRNIGEYIFGGDLLHIVRYPSPVDVARVMSDYPKAMAAMAAPMYSHTGSGSCGGGVKPCTRQLDLSHGVNVGPTSRLANSGVLIQVVNGRASAKQGSSVDPTATVAIQTYPTLVWNGSPSGGGSESSVAGLGLLGDGRLIYLVASGGSLADLANLFISKGARYAGYCDAGSSAALYVRNEGWRGVHARAPKLPAWVLAEGPIVPTRGLSTGAKVAAGFGAALLLWLGAKLVFRA